MWDTAEKGSSWSLTHYESFHKYYYFEVILGESFLQPPVLSGRFLSQVFHLTRKQINFQPPSLSKLGVDWWIIHLVQATSYKMRSKVHVENCFSESFRVKFGMYQGSTLSPLIFITILENSHGSSELVAPEIIVCIQTILWLMVNQLKNYVKS